MVVMVEVCVCVWGGGGCMAFFFNQRKYFSFYTLSADFQISAFHA